VTLPEVSTWPRRVFPGFFGVLLQDFFWERSGERIGNDVNKKGKAGQKYVYILYIYIYGLFIEDVYIYTRIRKETCPFVGRKRKFFVRTTTTVKGQRVSHQLLE